MKVTPKDLDLSGERNGIVFTICKTLVEEGNGKIEFIKSKFLVCFIADVFNI